MSRGPQDALAVLRGLQIVLEAVVREQRDSLRRIWLNSSVRESFEGNVRTGSNYLRGAADNPAEELRRLQDLAIETKERFCVVAEGFRLLASVKMPQDFKVNPFQNTSSGGSAGDHVKTAINRTVSNSDANLDISSITLRELEEILSKRNKDREINLRISRPKKAEAPEPEPESKPKPKVQVQVEVQAEAKPEVKLEPKPLPKPFAKPEATQVSTTAAISPPSSDSKDTKLVKEQDVNPTSSSIFKSVPKTVVTDFKEDTAYVESILKLMSGTNHPEVTSTTGSAAKISLPELSKVAKQRRVPSSRIGRLASFGGLFAGLGLGTLNELTKGALGFGGSTNMKEALLSSANADRIVDTLCKVRGAALKIGQILSIQDSTVVSPQLAKAFERVRQAADYMPDWQVERVMSTQLGPDWRNSMVEFNEKPFAAASIGQVHRGVIEDGTEVAIKIQYPGVAQSIESDIDNLVGMLKVWDVFPQGFFIDNMVKVAKRELNWEVNYEREAEYTEKFREMIAPYEEYYVPKVIRNLTTSNVLTTELVPGVPLDRCFDLSEDHRKHIAECVMKLCLRELFEVQCMQTDPNWSNFLYDVNTRRLMLIDFGSTRFYQREFIKNYRTVIIHAANDNRQGVLDMSRQMGFLTGYETKQMEEAHVDAVMILGEIFRFDGEFDFANQNTTERIVNLVPIMVAHRLCPPPDEVYSIHRKLSGTFLLCARLNAKLNCRQYYEDIVLNQFKD